MNREILPGLFLEVTGEKEVLTACRLTTNLRTSSLFTLSPSLERMIDHFLDCWQKKIHKPIPDHLFFFPESLARWAPLLLHLKNTVIPGEMTTYHALGTLFGIHPRTVGMILARNPFPLLIPCHRVVGSNGRLTGFSAEGGTNTKRRLLQFEGALVRD